MWQRLEKAFDRSQERKIVDLFENDNRFREFSASFGQILFDFCKTNLDQDGLNGLIELAEHQGVADKRDAMFAGDKINSTEDRSVLHTALRNLSGDPTYVDGVDVMPEILATLARMQQFCRDVRSGAIAGQGGTYSDVVNIGIGGSDLGPAMATRALASYRDGPKCHFVSNVHSAHLADTLAQLDPTTTLVIVASKSFTTQETMLNANSALNWMAEKVSRPEAQFVAISTSDYETAQFGIPPERVFGFEDWVGGRYSVWGPIGLSLMLAIGADDFNEFLRGGAAMDQHFQTAELGDNLPVLLALIGIWHHQLCGYSSRAVIPYDQRLDRLPAYLQQLEMESNGKSVALDGSPLRTSSGPIVWGEPGTNSQHAFFQLLHQGTEVVPCEFLLAAQSHETDLAHHQSILTANCLAQSQALMVGRSLQKAREICQADGLQGAALETIARHRSFSGNRPSTTLIYPKLTPFVLGQIIALYEHRVFVEGVVLGINSFDQWGVELGKELAKPLIEAVAGGIVPAGTDGSTVGLLAALARMQDK